MLEFRGISPIVRRVVLRPDSDCTDRVNAVLSKLDTSETEKPFPFTAPVSVNAAWLIPKHCGPLEAEDFDVILLYFHGGGYCVGYERQALASFSYVFNEMRNRYPNKKVAVLSVDYPLAPENPFEVSLASALTSYAWLLEATRKIGTLKKQAPRIVVGGDSAGGNLTLALGLLLQRQFQSNQKRKDSREKVKLQQPTGMLLVSPWMDAGEIVEGTTASISDEKTHDYITVGALNRFNESILAASKNLGLKSPDVSLLCPKNSPIHLIRGLVLHEESKVKKTNDESEENATSKTSRILVVSGTRELFYAANRDFVEKARSAGLNVEFVEGDGQPHIYPLLLPFFEVPAKKALGRIADFLCIQ
eukprot:g4323.t1